MSGPYIIGECPHCGCALLVDETPEDCPNAPHADEPA